MQAAGEAGLLEGIKGLENVGPGSEEGQEQLQPRVGLRLRRAGQRQGRHPRRLGHLQDMGYTNSNGLFAAIDAPGAASARC